MVTKITNTFDEEEISKLSIGEKIQKGYYEVIDEEEWHKDMQAKYGSKSAELEKTKKQLDIAVECLKNYKSGTTDKWFAEVALEQIEELNK